ncbi:heavy-metal-associated domain-containing protein [Clostridium sp.]|uniref:heavy-metal-associated domain-containing protein n=1 Tax=Clostridium sp. TaxID=1506 RepID=UPI002606A639|nr:cation transporter [uncultured Clostridium sp.]
MKKKILVEGMSCGHCVKHVSEALKEIGAKEVEVNLESKLATAEIGDSISDDAIKAAIEDAGYDVIKIEKA